MLKPAKLGVCSRILTEAFVSPSSAFGDAPVGKAFSRLRFDPERKIVAG